MATTKKKTPAKTVRFDIKFKDPDLPEPLRKFGDCGEYFGAEIEVDAYTGCGTIRFIKQ